MSPTTTPVGAPALFSAMVPTPFSAPSNESITGAARDVVQSSVVYAVTCSGGAVVNKKEQPDTTTLSTAQVSVFSYARMLAVSR